ncbi:MAG: T9SS type A sorting domain-containing protein [Bacteroidetes bacterium]|nr:T9SS type A sorting domain-containing protein [Bacteroidota bacterium]
MKLDEFVAESENPIAIFPNPASQNAEIVFVMEEDATAEIEIYNLSGQKYPLQNNMINGMGGQEITHEINVNELPAGIYQVFVTTSYGQVLTEKLAVVR